MSGSYWKGFWSGAILGAGTATSALLFTNLWGRAGRSRILRLEKSIQIGRPIEEVFSAWRALESLPAMSRRIVEIQRSGNYSRWHVRMNGRDLVWEAEIEQVVPNQSIGWKSIRGLRHTGRISFSPIGADTLVHVTMNYVPPSRLLRPLLAPMTGNLEGFIEAVLRDFKHALENVDSYQTKQSGPRIYPAGTTTEPARSTGTWDSAPHNPAQTSDATQHTRLGGHPTDLTAPPEAKR